MARSTVYDCFNSDHQVTEHFHEFAMGLQRDGEGIGTTPSLHVMRYQRLFRITERC